MKRQCFLLNIEAVVGEGNPEHRPFSEQARGCALCSVTSFSSPRLVSSVGAMRWVGKKDLVYCGRWFAISLRLIFSFSLFQL